jgi:hypothetical protein
VGLRLGDLEEGDDNDRDEVEKAGNWCVRWERQFFGGHAGKRGWTVENGSWFVRWESWFLGEHAGTRWTVKNGSWFVRWESWFLGELAGGVGSSDWDFPLHPLFWCRRWDNWRWVWCGRSCDNRHPQFWCRGQWLGWRWGGCCSFEDQGDLDVSVGDGGAVCERWDRMSGSALDKSQHVGCGLAKVFISGDLWERDFVREPIDSERITNTAGAGDM